jgi:hypothetical protein
MATTNPIQAQVVGVYPQAVVVQPAAAVIPVFQKPPTSPPKQEQWVSGFCDCCSYMEVDDDGKSSCMWCPYFVPMGLCGTCCLLGRIQTLITKEDKNCCCDMGTEGCLCCLVSTPINIAGPFGGFCWFAFNSVNMRRMVVERYNIQENTGCPTLCIGICFPLSLFQVLMKLRQLDRDNEL